VIRPKHGGSASSSSSSSGSSSKATVFRLLYYCNSHLPIMLPRLAETVQL
jgi:hypothetical protein